MGDLSNLCELRGRALEGKGCTLFAGQLKYCAKQKNRAFGGHRDCTTSRDMDALVEPAVSAGGSTNPVPPSGYSFVVDGNGNYLTDGNGNYLIVGA